MQGCGPSFASEKLRCVVPADVATPAALSWRTPVEQAEVVTGAAVVVDELEDGGVDELVVVELVDVVVGRCWRERRAARCGALEHAAARSTTATSAMTAGMDSLRRAARINRTTVV